MSNNSGMQYREANLSDIPALAQIRADEGNTFEYWTFRIAGYMNGELHPQKALLPRIVYVAVENDIITGFISGHLTERFGCKGELQWINVIPAYRGKGIAAELIQLLAKWFVPQKTFRVCVDVGTEAGCRLYKRLGAENINEHWMVWEDISKLLN
jgi:ribosomal protein S18 acetylase RimI-like enzyme